MKAGIVGLPNVGKSTLFNCLSNAKAQSANFPFCTIEPNIGVVNVPDQRLEKLEELVNPERVIPATVEIVDIAGLVKGASKGEGLGNQFLGNIRETDAIEGSASPRNPKLEIRKRSEVPISLLVACRCRERWASADDMPIPLSVIPTRAVPPSRTSIRILVASASKAFSTSSFTTDAGRSTTSPAAI